VRPARGVGHRHERAAEARHEAGVCDRDVLDLEHGHADARGRVRVFTHRADVEAEARLVEHHGGQPADEEREPGEQAVPREDAAQKRDLLHERDRDVGDRELGGDEAGRGGHGLALREVRDDLAQKQRAAGAHHVDGDADEGDVGPELEGEEAHHEAHQRAHRERGEQAQQPARGVVAHHRARERGEHHDALETDVAEPGLLDDDGAQRGEQDRGRDADDREEELGREQQLQKVKHGRRPLPSFRSLRASCAQAPPART